jgi:hypothetical protein
VASKDRDVFGFVLTAMAAIIGVIAVGAALVLSFLVTHWASGRL